MINTILARLIAITAKEWGLPVPAFTKVDAHA
jgi:hypothetical protein